MRTIDESPKFFANKIRLDLSFLEKVIGFREFCGDKSREIGEGENTN